VRDVPADRRHIAHLRPADYAAGFDQAGRFLGEQKRLGNGGVGDARADVEVAIGLADSGHLRDAGDVHQRGHGRFAALLQFEEEISTAGHHARLAAVGVQIRERFTHRRGEVIVLPERHRQTSGEIVRRPGGAFRWTGRVSNAVSGTNRERPPDRGKG